MAQAIISRKDAIAQGLKHYFTGKPCKNGHMSKRWTVRRACIGCINDFHAKWYVANREKKSEKNRTYIRENPQFNLITSLRWRSKNLEKARANARQWHSDPINQRVHDSQRRERKRKVGGKHTAADLVSLLKQQSHLCAYCRVDLRKTKKHLDHIMPLVLGGSNDKSNLQWLCAPCNLSKGRKNPVQFAQELGRLL